LLAVFDEPKTQNKWQSKKNFKYKKASKPELPKPKPLVIPKNLKKINATAASNKNLFDSKLSVGNWVEHARFGKGEVKQLEGVGANIKAEINFKNEGTKKLLLKFAKLKIIG